MKRQALRVRVWLMLGLFVVAAILLARTSFAPQPPMAPSIGGHSAVSLDQAAVVRRLAGAVRLATVSMKGMPPPIDALHALHRHLRQSFPRAHRALLREELGHGALLYTWKGSDETLAPIILIAHQDTAPVDPVDLARWSRDPWSGDVANGTVWGRGALDNKSGLMAIMEAAEQLLKDGFAPRRTMYFAFGSDEEVGGEQGAGVIARVLGERGVHASLVLGEGGHISQGLLPDIGREVALVGLAEKGYASVHLTVQSPGGHSAQPDGESAIGILSRAVVALEANQMRARLTPLASASLDVAGAFLPFSSRMIVRNRWLLEPILINKMIKEPMGNAYVRTTAVATNFHGGVTDNVLAAQAMATVNFRILPGDTAADVMAHVRSVVTNPRVEIALATEVNEPTSVSPVQGEGYRLLSRTIGQLFPSLPVLPALVVSSTDARYYVPISREQLRFIPYRMTPERVRRVHGVDEGIPVTDYLDCVQFMAQFMRNATG